MPKVEAVTDKVQAAKGPYSQGVRVGNMVFVSGQLARDAHGNIVGKGDISAQAEQVVQNLKAVLEAAGASLDDVAKLTMFVTDINHLPKVLEVRQRYFTRPVFPASTTVEVSALAHPDLMLEIEAIAILE